MGQRHKENSKPCPCKSGRKYKKCCKKDDLRAKRWEDEFESRVPMMEREVYSALEEIESERELLPLEQAAMNVIRGVLLDRQEAKNRAARLWRRHGMVVMMATAFAGPRNW